MGSFVSECVSCFSKLVTPALLLAWASTSIVVALSGPFGTFYSQPFLWRLMYWSVILGASIPISLVVRVFWNQVIQRDPLWLEDLLTVLTMTVAFGFLLNVLNVWMIGNANHPAIDWRLTVLATFIISYAAAIIRNVFQAAAERESDQSSSQMRDRLLVRLDVPEGVRLSKVSSDNHHVRIATDDNAEHRVLMRLRDALSEIDVEQGMCVHRSHWVATNMIEKFDTVDGKEVVRLKCGREVPVGKKDRPELVKAGIIAA